MSKIKSNRLEPRATNGSLTIGNPESYTTFEGDVQIPGYATQEWVEDIVTEDIAVELSTYQKRDEKNKPNGYAGLDSSGHIPDDNLPGLTNKVSKTGDTMTGMLNFEMTSGEAINVAQSGKNNAKIWADGSIQSTGFKVDGDRQYDVEFGGSGHLAYNGTNKFNWGSVSTSSTVPLAMNSNKITGLAEPDDDQDAATKKYVDAISGDYVKKSGDTMTGTLTLSGTRDIDCAFGGNAKLTYNGHDAFEWGNSYNTMHQRLVLASTDRDIDVSPGTAGHLRYNGDDKLRWGTKVYVDTELDMTGWQIKNVSGPTEDNDVANRYYVDNASKNISGPVRIDADYATSDETVFGVYVNLTREEAVIRGYDPDTDAEGGPHSMEPEVKAAYGLMRVLGDGTWWAFNRIKGVSSPPGADFDVTNMVYVDSKVSAVVEALEARIASLEAKLA